MPSPKPYLRAKLIPKQPLARLTLSPQHTSLPPGQALDFKPRGFTEDGTAVPLDAVTWEASGGTVDASGHYVAPKVNGTFTITAMATGMKGLATAVVTKEALPPPPPPPADRVLKITWSGEVPWQKWTKFYTAVLSKFAAGQGLNLKLTVEIAPEGGISNQKIADTKAALRELGMNDDLTPT